MFRSFLIRLLTKLVGPVPVQVEVVQMHRLNIDQYQALVDQCPRLASPNDPIQAGVMVGAQIVLEKLRKGYVVGA